MARRFRSCSAYPCGASPATIALPKPGSAASSPPADPAPRAILSSTSIFPFPFAYVWLRKGKTMKRIFAFAYGVACYAVFFATLLYAIGFLGNFVVPKSIDSGPQGSMTMALIVDGGLLALFALQHSIMARPWFKRAWTRMVPEPVERSTYVLFSSLALLFMFWQWRPMGGVIWDVGEGIARTILLGLYAKGLLVVLLSTFLINRTTNSP